MQLLDPNPAFLCPCHSRGSSWDRPGGFLCTRCKNPVINIRDIFSNLVSQTLTVFLTSILSKKYTNPSSDVITVLAGLDEVDHVISDFVAVLDRIIRNGSSGKSLPVLLLTEIVAVDPNFSSRCAAQGHQDCHCHDQRSIQN